MLIADMTGQDTGGQSFKLARAIRDYTEHTSYSFCKGQDYLKFPLDTPPKDYLEGVDVIHCHNFWGAVSGWGKVNPNAKRIIHQHGRFGSDEQFQEHLRADAVYGAKRFVSTLNLLHYVDNDPERWIPAPVRLSEFDELKKLWQPSDKVRICHTPTNRRLKHTDLFLKVVNELIEEGLPIELILLEKVDHQTAIKAKAQSDIVYDQLLLQYGNSGLEAMALGIPAICGCNCRDTIKKLIGYEPFVYATEDTLKEIIKELVLNKEYRELKGKEGRKYIEEWHDDRKVAEKMIGIYKCLTN